MKHSTSSTPAALATLIASITLALPYRAGSAPAAPGEKKDSAVVRLPASKPLYWADPRLERAVSFPGESAKDVLTQRDPDPEIPSNIPAFRVVRLVQGRVVSGEELMEAFRKATGVSIMLQADWLREYVAAPQKGSPARELMDALAASFGGKWLKQGETWILARSLEEARLTLLSPDDRGRSIRENTAQLFRSFTPEQWQKMMQREGLSFGELAPPQQTAVALRLRLYYYDPTDADGYAPGPQALGGQGVGFHLSGSGKRASVLLTAPITPGKVGPFDVLIPFYDEQTGELRFGVPPPR